MWPMSWWKWTCSERGGCSLILQRPLGLWTEESFLLFAYTLFWRLLAAQSFLLQQVNNQLVHNFLPQQNTGLFLFLARRHFLFLYKIWFICGWPRPVNSRSAKLPGWRSPPIVTIVTHELRHTKKCCVARGNYKPPGHWLVVAMTLLKISRATLIDQSNLICSVMEMTNMSEQKFSLKHKCLHLYTLEGSAHRHNGHTKEQIMLPRCCLHLEGLRPKLKTIGKTS